MSKPKRSRENIIKTVSSSSEGETDFAFPELLRHKNFIYWSLFLVFILFIVFIRFRMLGIPLERDEGEYAYMGQLMLQGKAPYTLAYNMKYPGTAVIYAFFISIFGHSPSGVHLGLLVTNVSSIILVLLIARNFMGRFPALISSFIFGILSLGYYVLGFAFHATHLVTLFALLGTWMMLKAFNEDKKGFYFGAGVFLCLSLIMKQTGIFFIFFGLISAFVHLYFNKKSGKVGWLKNMAWMGLGVFLPFFFMMGLIYLSGAFDKFWFWTYTYLKEYATKVEWSKGVEYFKYESGRILKGTYLIWLTALAGFILSLFTKNVRKEYKIILGLFCLFSIFTVIPGFYFRAHYFVPLIPAAGLFFGLFVDHLLLRKNVLPMAVKYAIWGFLFFAVLIAIKNDSEYLFNQSPNQISRSMYGANPFAETLPISKYIKANTKADDRIAVLGSEPQIYFYSDRISATGHIYTYSLMEPQEHNLQMQKEMAKEIETNNPTFIVYVFIPTSWNRDDGSKTFLFDWAQDYLNKYYSKVGVVDFISKDETVFKWDSEVSDYSVKSQLYINVYKRR